MTEQLGMDLRDKALAKVTAANRSKIDRAVEQIRVVAPLLKTFTTDDLFPDPDAWKFTSNTALGPAMLKAARLGLIKKTNWQRKSKRGKCHCRPKSVWVAAD